MNAIRSSLVQQFGNPSGLLGMVAGLIMRVRPSNRLRNQRTIELLEIRPGDRVLEVGFGPGLAVKGASELATSGKVIGIDHSALMLREARRRNAVAIRAGRVELLLGSADALPRFDERFDKVLAVNVFMFWKDPVSVLAGLREVMKPGAVIALTLQPRRGGATVDDTRAAAERMAAALRDAGYGAVRKELMEMAPVPAACVLGRAPPSARPARGSGRLAGEAGAPHFADAPATEGAAFSRRSPECGALASPAAAAVRTR